MSSKKTIFMILGSLSLVFISGCNCNNAAVSVFEVLQDSPVAYSVVSSLTPTFTWHGSDTCEPDFFRLTIRENRIYGPGDSANAEIDGDETSYTLTGDSLLPGREYYWRMSANNEFEPGTTDDYTGPNAPKDFFYTGPVCPGGPLVAPDLEYPFDPGGNPEYDNWITHAGPQDFNWTYSGGCLPEFYDYQFATDPGFTDIVLSGTTTEPYLMHLYETFPNCTSLFWRIAARVGSTVGPWSDAQQFHWVMDDTCWQTNYISDDAARINVRLYQEQCDQTGFYAGGVTSINPGCIHGEGSSYIQGNGIFDPYEGYMYNVKVNLGSGPCPSTGLDSKKFSFYEFFYVTAPGTYCVSISKDQSVTPSFGGSPKDLNDGRWTDPSTTGLVAERTVELGPGVQDVFLEFGWDEYDNLILYYTIPENIFCRLGPEPICDPLAIPLAGTELGIIGRDRNTEWKQTAYGDQQCFVYLPAVQIDQALVGVNSKLFTADLPIFDPQPPCPTPTPEPRESSRKCSSYTDSLSCRMAGCTWHENYTRPGGYCSAD